MKLKSITLCFENCDWITIEGKYIGNMIVDDLHVCFKKIACNYIEKVETANIFAIEIQKDANKERYEFEQMSIEEFKQMTFDRLKEHKDITSIKFEMEEQYVKEGQVPKVDAYDYWVNWVGDSDNFNEAQTNYISKEGNLYIVIAEGKGIEDFFDMEEINDSASMKFHFKWCGMGNEQ